MCWDSRPIILKKLGSYPIFFIDFNSPCKDLLFPRCPNLAQKPLCLVSSLLNKPTKLYDMNWKISWSFVVQLTFTLFTIDFSMLGGGRYVYATCPSRVEWGNWYDSLVRTVLGRGILWRRAQIFCYIHSGLLLTVNGMSSMMLGFIWRVRENGCFFRWWDFWNGRKMFNPRII